MDGRPHPPEYAPHTWQGFSTGRFEGGVLVVRTTHLKAGWIRRNGLTLSDEVTMTERFIRHGNYLTHIYMIEDPRYLTEPLIKTNGFVLTNNVAMQPYPCEAVDRGAARQGRSAAPSAGHQHLPRGIRQEAQPAGRGHPRRGRDGAAGVHEADVGRPGGRRRAPARSSRRRHGSRSVQR